MYMSKLIISLIYYVNIGFIVRVFMVFEEEVVERSE